MGHEIRAKWNVKLGQKCNQIKIIAQRFAHIKNYVYLCLKTTL